VDIRKLVCELSGRICPARRPRRADLPGSPTSASRCSLGGPEDIMPKRRLVVEEVRRAGHSFSQPDLIITATALHHDLTVVTRDAADWSV
jgi:hypothetical protein